MAPRVVKNSMEQQKTCSQAWRPPSGYELRAVLIGSAERLEQERWETKQTFNGSAGGLRLRLCWRRGPLSVF
mgnify:FL=1